MPELPDIVVAIECLEARIRGRVLEQLRVPGISLLRSVEPPPAAAEGRRVTALARLGKRIVIELERELFLVLHLMIAGRLRWRPAGGAPRSALASLRFESGTLLVTETGRKKRASLHLVQGRTALAAHDPGGLEPLDADLAEFGDAIRRENHTLKRVLTDPHLLSGVGNAYSDEILHRARLSPLQLSQRLGDAEIERLYHAARDTLREWSARIRAEVGDGFPEKMTAFREGMAVHGRYRKPCPVCGSPVQRIRYAESELNYCARCQTGGRLLADRALSRLMHADWPRTLEELEARRPSGGR